MEKKREKEAEHLFEEIIAENFSNLEKETNISVQKAERVPNKMNPKRFRPRQIIIKMAKIKGKERILKPSKEKQLVIIHTRELL